MLTFCELLETLVWFNQQCCSLPFPSPPFHTPHRHQHQQRSTLQRFNAQEGMSSLSHYRERPGQQLPERARKRVQKMMHYQVRFRHFSDAYFSDTDTTRRWRN